MSLFDPAVTLADQRKAQYEADQKIAPLNPPFPYRMNVLDLEDFGLFDDPPKPIDTTVKPS